MRRRGVAMEDVEKSLQRHAMKFFLKRKQEIPGGDEGSNLYPLLFKNIVKKAGGKLSQK